MASRRPIVIVETLDEKPFLDMPPELVRKGRFDEIFFVDLPTPRARVTILHIHLGNLAMIREPSICVSW